MEKLRYIALSLLISLGGLWGTLTYADTINLPFSANTQLNVDNNNQASPTEIIIFQLSAEDKFNSGDFFSLYDNPAKYLGDSYVSEDRFQILPNQTINRSIILDNNTEYVAIIAAYSNLKKITWRKIIPVSDLNTYDIQVNLGVNGITLNQKKAVHYSLISGPYIEGALGVNSLSVSGSEYSVVTQVNDAPIITNYNLAVKDASVTPMINLAAGYQWAMSTKDEFGFLRLSSATLGGSIYAMNDLTLTANSTIVPNNGTAYRLSSTDTLSANLKALFVETKIGFLAMGRFVPYTTLGIGMAQLDSISYTQTTANQQYTASENTARNIAFKAELGMDFYVYNHLAIGAGYQYMNAGNFELQTLPSTDNGASAYADEPKISVKINSVLFKVRYIF